MKDSVTLQPKTAVEMAKDIREAIDRNRIPVIISDQPALAYIVAHGVVGEEAAINKTYSDAAVMDFMKSAIEYKTLKRKVAHIIILKADKSGAGTFPGSHFVKIVSKRLFITMGSVAGYLVGGE